MQTEVFFCLLEFLRHFLFLIKIKHEEKVNADRLQRTPKVKQKQKTEIHVHMLVKPTCKGL